jgi:hypothetical protein
MSVDLNIQLLGQGMSLAGDAFGKQAEVNNIVFAMEMMLPGMQ